MKFYGIQIGCNNIFTPVKDQEVVTLTTFSESSTRKSLNELSKIAKDIKLEGEYETIRENDPDLTRIARTIRENSHWSHHTYHYLIKVDKLDEVKEILDRVFPRRYYTQLKS